MNVSQMKHLNAGECADIYEVNSTTVLKLSKPGWQKNILYQEYQNAKTISDSNVPAPRIYKFVEIGDRYGYTMEKLNDQTILDAIKAHPHRIFFYAKKMAHIHHQIHTAPAPSSIPPLEEGFRKMIAQKISLSEKEKSLLLSELESLCNSSQVRICHGDYHPMNVLIDGKKYSVIDWILAKRGMPAADVAGAYLIASVYSPNLGTSAFKRALLGLGGTMYAKAYLKHYTKISGVTAAEVLRWIPIRAAIYLDVGLPEHLNKAFLRIVRKHCTNLIKNKARMDTKRI